MYLRIISVIQSAAEEEDSEMREGAETILLVEDEEPIRALVRIALEERGYTVLAAADGVAALELADAHAGRIDLLITDVVMPRMGGRVLADHLIRRRPGIKVIYMSGYADDLIGLEGLPKEDLHFVPKPCPLESLLRLVRQIL